MNMGGLTRRIITAVLTGLLWMYVQTSAAGEPYTGTPIVINGAPGSTTFFEAENYNLGGEGDGYHDPHACGAVPYVAAPMNVPKITSTDTTPPTAPQNLVATAVSPTQVNLTWDAATDNVWVMSYQVYLNDVWSTSTFTRSFQHTGLTPGATYNYRVSAVDPSLNFGPWSATPVTVTTPLTASQRCSCVQTYRPDGVNVCQSGAVTYISYDDAGLWVEYTIQVSRPVLNPDVVSPDIIPGTAPAYTVELLAANSLPAISMTIDGGSNLPLNGTTTKVTVSFIGAGPAPTLVELSRDGQPPFAAWPAGVNSTSWLLASDKKSISRDWCISNGCWGGVTGAHVLTATATFAGGFISTVSIPLTVADGQTANPPVIVSAAPAVTIEFDGARYPADPAKNYVVPLTSDWLVFAWGAKSDLIPMSPGIHKLRIRVSHGWFNWDSVRVHYAQDTAGVWNGYGWVPIMRVFP